MSVTCFLSLICALVGCGGGADPSRTITAAPGAGLRGNFATALLHPVAGNGASGTATLRIKPSTRLLNIDVEGLDPTHGQAQYGLWQLETPEDRISLKTPEDMVGLASYRVGTDGHLSVVLKPTGRVAVVEEGHLTHFLVTLIDSPEHLEESILEFDASGKPPDLGRPVAEGTFRGPLVGVAESR
jgi:hypothetical protein